MRRWIRLGLLTGLVSLAQAGGSLETVASAGPNLSGCRFSMIPRPSEVMDCIKTKVQEGRNELSKLSIGVGPCRIVVGNPGDGVRCVLEKLDRTLQIGPCTLKVGSPQAGVSCLLDKLASLAQSTTGGCSQECKSDQVRATSGYNYPVRRSALHCQDAPSTCKAAQTLRAFVAYRPGAPMTPDSGSVVYHWPVDEAAGRVRTSALQATEPIFTLPFSDRLVTHVGTWRYVDGSYHHAIDYSRPDQATFQVRAAAPGTVIHIGWDEWSGNTVVVSHDAEGRKDAYRTLYMHMRNGADVDCEAGWSRSVPTLKDTLPAYKQHLESTGCPQDRAKRSPFPAFWGKNGDRIDPRLLGKHVNAGDALGWAGSTGPGGKKGPGAPNTHLHIFFARRDPTQPRGDDWYFIDPYGIYALPSCYPLLLSPARGACARFPISWKGARPQYP